mgnify:CR=1 FL=1
MRIATIYILCMATLAGCAGTTPPVAQLEPPSPRLMRKSEPLPEVKVGDDLVEANAQCRAEYGRETGRLSGLQGYVRVITKKK